MMHDDAFRASVGAFAQTCTAKDTGVVPAYHSVASVDVLHHNWKGICASLRRSMRAAMVFSVLALTVTNESKAPQHEHYLAQTVLNSLSRLSKKHYECSN